MKISILLSTYNGELYLKEQIDSIFWQTINDWVLYIRDDGSTDHTVNIINDFIERFPEKIKLINDSLGNLRSASSFMYLLSQIDSDYYMFCDQDDVWLPFKIEKTILKLKYLESMHPNKGVLVFTDLTVVDSNLKRVDHSMWHYSGINPDNAKNFYRTACLSTVTGCTMMFNHFIKEKVLPYPKVARMHDWWISLNAVHCGVVDYVNEPTMLYRQHGLNVLGADKINKNHYLKKVLLLKNTIKDNFEVLKMLRSLNFRKNYIKIYSTKIKIILTKKV
jgi:glycosyltransferase involved in cell wall biosynthesis